MKRSVPAVPFLALGAVFIAVGAAGNRTFLVLGLAFMAIGAVFFAKQRRGG